MWGCFPTPEMQTPPLPPPLKSGHLDIEDAQCTKKLWAQDFISHHITFGLALIFCMNEFFRAIPSIRDVTDSVYIFCGT